MPCAICSGPEGLGAYPLSNGTFLFVEIIEESVCSKWMYNNFMKEARLHFFLPLRVLHFA